MAKTFDENSIEGVKDTFERVARQMTFNVEFNIGVSSVVPFDQIDESALDAGYQVVLEVFMNTPSIKVPLMVMPIAVTKEMFETIRAVQYDKSNPFVQTASPLMVYDLCDIICEKVLGKTLEQIEARRGMTISKMKPSSKID